MEDVQSTKRRRRHSSEPNVVVYAAFPRKYIGYLLPGLLQATSCEDKDQELKQKVRFEVDMALVVSSGGFSWSSALKQKLDQQVMNTSSFSLEVIHSRNAAGYRLEVLRPQLHPHIPRPLVPIGKATRVNRAVEEQDEDLAFQMRMLRMILPGGWEMGMPELLSGVESYVICLQMQVNILRSLVDSQ